MTASSIWYSISSIYFPKCIEDLGNQIYESIDEVIGMIVDSKFMKSNFQKNKKEPLFTLSEFLESNMIIQEKNYNISDTMCKLEALYKNTLLQNRVTCNLIENRLGEFKERIKQSKGTIFEYRAYNPKVLLTDFDYFTKGLSDYHEHERVKLVTRLARIDNSMFFLNNLNFQSSSLSKSNEKDYFKCNLSLNSPSHDGLSLYINDDTNGDNIDIDYDNTDTHLRNNKKYNYYHTYNLQSEDIFCYVCNDGDFNSTNEIVYCSICCLAVHQKCFFIDKIPEDDWLCDVCLILNDKQGEVPCVLCTIKGGAMKQVNIRTTSKIFKSISGLYDEAERNISKCNEQVDEFINNLKSTFEKDNITIDAERVEDDYETYIDNKKNDKNFYKPSRSQGNEEYSITSKSDIKANYIKYINIQSSASESQSNSESSYILSSKDKVKDKIKEKDNKNQLSNQKYNQVNDRIQLEKSKFSSFHYKVNKKSEYCWSHLSCLKWNSSFEKVNFSKNPINIIEVFNLNEYIGKCDICKKSNFGYIVKCFNSNCDEKFHVECARLEKYMFEEIEVGDDDEVQSIIYCHKHRYCKLTKEIEKINARQRREILNFATILSNSYQNIKKTYKSELFYNSNSIPVSKYSFPYNTQGQCVSTREYENNKSSEEVKLDEEEEKKMSKTNNKDEKRKKIRLKKEKDEIKNIANTKKEENIERKIRVIKKKYKKTVEQYSKNNKKPFEKINPNSKHISYNTNHNHNHSYIKNSQSTSEFEKYKIKNRIKEIFTLPKINFQEKKKNLLQSKITFDRNISMFSPRTSFYIMTYEEIEEFIPFLKEYIFLMSRIKNGIQLTKKKDKVLDSNNIFIIRNYNETIEFNQYSKLNLIKIMSLIPSNTLLSYDEVLDRNYFPWKKMKFKSLTYIDLYNNFILICPDDKVYKRLFLHELNYLFYSNSWFSLQFEDNIKIKSRRKRERKKEKKGKANYPYCYCKESKVDIKDNYLISCNGYIESGSDINNVINNTKKNIIANQCINNGWIHKQCDERLMYLSHENISNENFKFTCRDCLKK